MSLLTPDQTAQLIKNGHRPDDDHKPVVWLRETGCVYGQQPVQFMFSYIEPDYPHQIYGLLDLGHGKPRTDIVFLPILESINPRYNIEVLPVSGYDFTHPLSVYAQAARMMGKITTSSAALQWAATQLELTKSRDQFSKPLLNPDGPAFLPFSPN